MSGTPVDQLRRERDYLRGQLRELAGDAALVGDSPAVQRLRAQLRAAAAANTPALLRGEPGADAEALARHVHDHSTRAGGPFVALHCAEVPDGMLASELFGHVRGAFPEALGDRAGLLELGERGTLYISELCELPPALQTKLARVMQERALVREGDSRAQELDVRVLASTRRAPRAELAAGRLTRALFYSLSAVTIEVPPLRERAEDIIPLARQRLARLARRLQLPPPTLTRADEARLAAHPWPGNTRELELVLERALLLATSTGEPFTLRLPATALMTEDADQLEPSREEVESALTSSDWVIARAARRLGLSRQALYRRIERYALQRPGGCSRR